MESQFSFKDFENVRLKATSRMEIGNRTIEPGETIAVFDKVQIARVIENLQMVSAHGGFQDKDRVYWMTTKNEQISFAQGVFSPTQFALMTNAQLIEYARDSSILITNEEALESDEHGYFTLKEIPATSLWIYNKATGAKITNYGIEDKVVQIETPYLDVVAIYDYNYLNGAKEYKIGQRLFEGFVELEGRTRVKDDISGQIVTGILKIPKLKLMSNLSITLGKQAAPVVGNFSALAIPVGHGYNTYVSEFYILNDDIESDL